jgi:hypothetical protein
MPILNYTTSIEAIKTAGEIQGILAMKGARQISIDYDTDGSGLPISISFMILLFEQPVYFRLPINVDGVFESMTKYGSKVPPRLQTREQAQRVAWRILKDWVEAQMALVEAKQAQIAEVFLSYAVDNSGRTFFEVFAESKQKLLTAGEPQAEVISIDRKQA